MPSIVEMIEAKRDGMEIPDADWQYLVALYTKGNVPDYQMSAMLMAIYFQGLSRAETFSLTKAMVDSGQTLDLSSIKGVTFDKHSTGGIGDKVSPALVAIVAAAGLSIAKMSGRGLGITGGTLDKLESICGFRTALSPFEIISQVQEIGACICAQTDDIVPADKKIYALRDVTGTVESIPLIAASVMSKKVAGGADVILLDVKVGRGAFMKDIDGARQLALLMQEIGEKHGVRVSIELTAMDIPLGRAVGNLMEIKEVSDFLRGRKVDARLSGLILEFAQIALQTAGIERNAVDFIQDGSAWSKFSQMVERQGGTVASIDRWDDVIPVAIVKAASTGYVADIDAELIGRASVRLGAGREKMGDTIDPLAGVWLNAMVGEQVDKGDIVATLYGKPDDNVQSAVETIKRAFVVEQDMVVEPPVVLERMPALDR